MVGCITLGLYPERIRKKSQHWQDLKALWITIPLDEPREVRLWELYRGGKEFHKAPWVILGPSG
jgi:hypothetical protein